MGSREIFGCQPDLFFDLPIAHGVSIIDELLASGKFDCSFHHYCEAKDPSDVEPWLDQGRCGGETEARSHSPPLQLPVASVLIVFP